jgi:hypothetical protein
MSVISRPLTVCTFRDKTTTTPRKTGELTWGESRQLGSRGYGLDPGKRFVLGLALKHSIMGRVRSGGDPAEIEDRKIVEFKKRQAAPRGPVPDKGAAAPDEVDGGSA